MQQSNTVMMQSMVKLASKFDSTPRNQTVTNDAAAQALQRMTDTQTCTSFRYSFPKTAEQVWHFGLNINIFKTENMGVSRNVLLRKILEQLKGADKILWNEYILRDMRRLMNADDTLSETIARDRVFTFETLDKWLFSRWTITINRFKLMKYLDLIQFRRNERPMDVWRRTDRAFLDIDNIVSLYNKSRADVVDVTKQALISPLDDQDKLLTICRIFIFDNGDAEFGNDGHLNGKMVEKITQEFQNLAHNGGKAATDAQGISTATSELDAMRLYIDQLEDIITKNAINAEKMKTQFVSYSQSQMPSINSFYSGKGKRKPTRKSDPNEPPNKRQRFADRMICPQGSRCKNVLKYGNCINRHPKPEFVTLYQKWKSNALANDNVRKREQKTVEKNVELCPYAHNRSCRFIKTDLCWKFHPKCRF
eukprot:20777_1